MPVQRHMRRLFRCKMSKFTQLSHPFQKAGSLVNEANATGLYPNSLFIFMTASPVVNPNILASGNRSRDNSKALRLILLAKPCPR